MNRPGWRAPWSLGKARPSHRLGQEAILLPPSVDIDLPLPDAEPPAGSAATGKPPLDDGLAGWRADSPWRTQPAVRFRA